MYGKASSGCVCMCVCVCGNTNPSRGVGNIVSLLYNSPIHTGVGSGGGAAGAEAPLKLEERGQRPPELMAF